MCRGGSARQLVAAGGGGTALGIEREPLIQRARGGWSSVAAAQGGAHSVGVVAHVAVVEHLRHLSMHVQRAGGYNRAAGVRGTALRGTPLRNLCMPVFGG